MRSYKCILKPTVFEVMHIDCLSLIDLHRLREFLKLDKLDLSVEHVINQEYSDVAFISYKGIKRNLLDSYFVKFPDGNIICHSTKEYMEQYVYYEDADIENDDEDDDDDYYCSTLKNEWIPDEDYEVDENAPAEYRTKL